MRPVTIAEIQEASQRWMADPKIHLTRRVGPTSVESFKQIALKWFRIHNAIWPPVPTTPFDIYLAQFLSFSLEFRSSPAKSRYAAISATPTGEARLNTAARLVGEALSSSDVRTERIATLQRAIAEGTYRVASSKVAGKLLKELLR